MYIIVAGAGIIGRQITQLLVASKHNVVVLDKDPEICEMVYTETGATTVQGNATDLRTLESAGANKADVILCLMRLSADNIACTLLAKSLGIPRVIARLRNPRYEEAYRLAGVTTIVRMADLLVNQILMEIEQPRVKKIMTIGGGLAEIYSVKIPTGSKAREMTIKDITSSNKFPNECVFIGIYREPTGEYLIPRGSNNVKEDDIVYLVSKSQYIKQAADFLEKKR